MLNTYKVHIVGNGLLASKFLNTTFQIPVLIFASGVSNSLEENETAFNREIELLQQHLTTPKLLIYFSSYSVTYKQSAYVSHKLHIEKLIQQHTPKYLILRLTNVVGNAGNSNTVINYLYQKIKTNQTFELYQNAERNFLDIDDVVLTVTNLINNNVANSVLNLGYSHNITMPQVMATIEQYLHSKAVYTINNAVVERVGNNFEPIITEHSATTATAYLQQILQKYFAKA